MASENLAKLQATINQFAKLVGFSPLTIDGGMGPKTEEALVRVLQFIETGCKGSCAGPTTMAAAGQGLVNADTPTGIMQNLAGLTQLLSGVAVVLSLGAPVNVALKQPSSGLAPDRNVFAVTPPPSMGMFDKTRLWARQLPQWQQAGLGVGGGILLLITLTQIKKSARKGR